MTSTLLLPLDGSEKDGRALAVAADFAELTDSNVHVVRVFDTPVDSLSGRAGILGVTDAARELRASTELSLRQAAASLEGGVRRTVSWEVIDSVDVASALVLCAEDRNVVLVVMATRAPGMVGRALLGSVADRLVREAPQPVLLVPPAAHYMEGKRLRLRRALVPHDGSHAALGVIDRLLDFPLADELEFVLIQVVHQERAGGFMLPPDPAVSLAVAQAAADSDVMHVSAEQAEMRLNEVAEGLRARGAAVEVRVVESGDPGAVIISAIRQELVHFIAMATRGERGFERLFHGSVANRVVRESEVPVLLLRASSTDGRASRSS